jgi:hypothetical protein
MKFRNSSTDVENEALGLIDFLGGTVQDVPNWADLSSEYFLNREIPEIEWSLIYDKALEIQHA